MPLRRRAWFVLAAIAAAAAFWYPALRHWSATGFGDWQQFLHQWEAARIAMVRYGEVPLWNPYHCGGTLLFGDPQAQGFSPLFFLFMPFGSAAGLKLFMIAHSAAGFGGMYVFARKHVNLDALSAACASFLWAGSGFFAWHGSGGHPAFMPFYFAPLILLAWRAAQVEWKNTVWVAALMALVIFEGGVYPFPYFVLLLAFDTLVITRSRVQFWQTLKTGTLAVVLTTLLAGFRLAGILTTIRDYPRFTHGSDSLRIIEVVEMLILPTLEHPRLGSHEYVWAEYGSYIGVLGFALCMLGLVVSLRRHRWVVAGSLVFLGFVLGHVSIWHPWPLVHRLPIYSSLRVPSRFMVLFLFFFALLGGLGLQSIRRKITELRRPTQRALALVPAALVALIIVQVMHGHRYVLDRWRGTEMAGPEEETEYHITPLGDYGDHASFPIRNVSTRGCYTGVTAYVAASGLWEGREPQVRVAGGELLGYRRTSQTMTARVRLEEEAESVVIFNQTWAPGWITNLGTVRRGSSGLIEVRELDAGEQRVVVRYLPKEAAWGAWVSLGGLLLSALLLFVARRRRRRREKPTKRDVPVVSGPPGEHQSNEKDSTAGLL